MIKTDVKTVLHQDEFIAHGPSGSLGMQMNVTLVNNSYVWNDKYMETIEMRTPD